MILPCAIPQLDIPDEGRNHIIYFILVSFRKIISVQEIYSDSLFKLNVRNHRNLWVNFPIVFIYFYFVK